MDIDAATDGFNPWSIIGKGWLGTVCTAAVVPILSSLSGRVRVAVRLWPATAEESVADADYSEFVELQPEFKRLKLRKNNWEEDTCEFNEVLIEQASQARVYKVVAKPVLESVMEGCNGIVMAYGQTGTGKTFTVGCLGDIDVAYRGMMVRAMEHILEQISPEADQVFT